MKAIILAGGIGSRLQPLTYNIPKPAISLFDKAFIKYQIELLEKHNVKDIVINTHYLHNHLENILGDGSELGVNIYYSHEEIPMGTAGSVKLAEKYFDDELIIILNGDILTDIDITSLVNSHIEKKADITLALTRVKNPTEYGLIFSDKDMRIKQFLEKPSYDEAVVDTVNAGVYIVSSNIFKDIPKNKAYSFERDLFPNLLMQGKRIFAYIDNYYWLDIGTPEKYYQAHKDALLNRIKLDIPAKNVSNNIWLGENVEIEETSFLKDSIFLGDNVKIKDRCFIDEFSVISENVILGNNSKVHKSIIFPNTRIGENCTIEKCIIGKNCTIEDYSRITKSCIIADNSVIKKGTFI